MKKSQLIFVILSTVLIFIWRDWTFFSVKAEEEADLLKIISVLEDEDIKITEWSLFAREKAGSFASLTEVKAYGQSLQEKFPYWQWKTNTASDHWELRGIHPSSSKGQEEIIKILAHGETNPQVYIIYELKGSSFTGQNEQFIKKEWPATAFDIFRENPTIFSCVKGEFNDTIDSTLPKAVDRLLAKLQAEKKEFIEENNFISTSAYSPIFADSIYTNETEMNVQLGMRSEGLGAKTTLVVGTPIITIEY